MDAAQPNGLCQCGCGATTPISQVNSTRDGRVKGNPVRFLPGHGRGRWIPVSEGQRFERLVALEERQPNQTKIKFRCDCGTVVELSVVAVERGMNKSCGCLAADYRKPGGMRTALGLNITHGMTGTPLYQSWAAMVQRTTNPKDPAWSEYGGRGITIDPRWLKFDAFLTDMGERPEGTSIDRIDNDAGYCKANCRWADRTTQNRNQRPRKDSRSTLQFDERHKAILALAADAVPMSAIAKQLGLGYNTVRRHLGRAR